MGQARTFGLIDSKFQFRPSIREATRLLAVDPSFFADIIISTAKQPSLQRRYRYSHHALDLQATMSDGEPFTRLTKHGPKLAHTAMRMVVLRGFMCLRVNRRIIGVTRDDERIDIGVEMQMANHRWQHLQDIRPATRTKTSRCDLSRRT